MATGLCSKLPGGRLFKPRPIRRDPAGAPITSLPRPLTTAEQSTLTAANDFSFALFRRVSKASTKDNVFISPISASMSLGMA